MDYICPQPIRWNELYKKLCKAYEENLNIKKGTNHYRLPDTVTQIRESGGPPTPLILNGWIFSTD